MAIEYFKGKNFHAATERMINECNSIISNYRRQGLRLTLRQLYYQLVSANKITNEEKSYKNLGNIVSSARLAGLLDWDAIEDRGRVVDMPGEWDNIARLVDSALYAYRRRRWNNQDNYIELWVEKQALAGVLEPIANEFHVALMVNKGYSSQSAMYAASKRYLKRQELGKDLHLIYLGDHDPSGEDMVRDISDRLEMFGVQDLTVTKIALTMAQIKQYNPPPNPAKMTDSRASSYVAEHGNSSWEVDALPPAVLSSLIKKCLTDLTDIDEMDRIKKLEEEDKEKLREAALEMVNNCEDEEDSK